MTLRWIFRGVRASYLRLAIFLACEVISVPKTQAWAQDSGRFGVFVGPPSAGLGDANPVTFVNPVEYEMQWVSVSGKEARLSWQILGGGLRWTSHWGGYLALGVGALINANGYGAGPYSGVGFDFFCVTLCASLDYVQGFGWGTGGFMAPHSLRLGVSLWY
jgi:hypothetical protein